MSDCIWSDSGGQQSVQETMGRLADSVLSATKAIQNEINFGSKIAMSMQSIMTMCSAFGMEALGKRTGFVGNGITEMMSQATALGNATLQVRQTSIDSVDNAAFAEKSTLVDFLSPFEDICQKVKKYFNMPNILKSTVENGDSAFRLHLNSDGGGSASQPKNSLTLNKLTSLQSFESNEPTMRLHGLFTGTARLGGVDSDNARHALINSLSQTGDTKNHVMDALFQKFQSTLSDRSYQPPNDTKQSGTWTSDEFAEGILSKFEDMHFGFAEGKHNIFNGMSDLHIRLPQTLQGLATGTVGNGNRFIDLLNQVSGMQSKAIGNAPFAELASANHELTKLQKKAWETLLTLKNKYEEFYLPAGNAALFANLSDSYSDVFYDNYGYGSYDNTQKSADNPAARDRSLIELLKSFAEREATNRITAAEIQVTVNSNAQLNSDMDIDDFISTMTDRMSSELLTTANRLYA